MWNLDLHSQNVDDIEILQAARFEQLKNPVIEYLNINNLRNKKIDWCEVLNFVSLDYFILSETKPKSFS